MITLNPREIKRLEAAVSQPNLSFLNFSLRETLTEVWNEHFREFELPEVAFVGGRGPLACICTSLTGTPIYIHSILSHPDTPRMVIGLICKHELLHLRVPPRTVGASLKCHPPEFWEALEPLAPERAEAERWIQERYWPWLRHRPRKEMIEVLPSWPQVWDKRDEPPKGEALLSLLSKDVRADLMLRRGGLYL